MKVYIVKDGHSLSDFSNEREALQWFAKNSGVEIAYEIVESIICSAIHYDNGLHYANQDIYGIETGFVLSGYRHPNILSVLPTNPYFLKGMFEKGDKEQIQKYEELNVKYGWQEDSLTRCKTVQGFLTSKGRFVDRKEAWKIALDAGQIDANGGFEKELFSEDLY